MPTEFKVSLAAILKELGFEAIYMPQNPDEVMIASMELSRPGLELAGFFDYYDNTRIVVFGRSEMAFLQEMEPARRNEIIDALFSRHAPAVLITRGQEPPEVLLSSSRRYSAVSYTHLQNAHAFVPRTKKKYRQQREDAENQ